MRIYEAMTFDAQLDETLLSERLVALLSAGFGSLATLLAAIRLYGVMPFVVARRRKEMGIRMALGVEPKLVLWLVMREVVILVTIGLAAGLPSALGLGRYVASELYGIKANDPAIATGTMALLIAVSGIAGLIPARRASRIDPVRALHYE